ncbi:hypothetical protein J6590_101654 [Homalodisca vitripennis]|nr:hypothetical protein J6590_101654 [Homalodisca vitripennis]
MDKETTSSDSEINTNKEKIAPQQSTIEDVHAKIQNLKDADRETSLTLAAEVRHALLIENSNLKQELHNQVLQNSELVKHITKLTELGRTELEMKFEELERENEALINRNMTLKEALNEAEHQLVSWCSEKEKELQSHLLLLSRNRTKKKSK